MTDDADGSNEPPVRIGDHEQPWRSDTEIVDMAIVQPLGFTGDAAPKCEPGSRHEDAQDPSATIYKLAGRLDRDCLRIYGIAKEVAAMPLDQLMAFLDALEDDRFAGDQPEGAKARRSALRSLVAPLQDVARAYSHVKGPHSPPKGVRRGREFWEQLVREVESGMTVAEVARRHGVSLATFNVWRRKFREEEGAARAEARP